MTQYTTWIEINRSALEHNVDQYRLWLPNQTRIAPVIKANAYGHGLQEVGWLHQQNKYITRLCVANTQEGIDLRKGGITKPILVLGFINTSLEEIIHHNLDLIVSDKATIITLNALAQKHQRTINVHLKIDTGLSRLGIYPNEFDTYLTLIKNNPFLNLQGIYSHFIEACNQEIVHQQEEVLNACTKQYDHLEIHTSNSNGSLISKYQYSFARIGAGLYGYLPEADPQLQEKLQPILSLKSRVIGIKKITAGQSVGYARTYTATKPTTLAILGMGYYEGIDPDLANTGRVIIHGKLASIVGRINMNYFTVDVTHIPQTNLHDVATVLGQDGPCQLSAYDWRIGAKKNVRIFLAKLNNNIPRIIVDQNQNYSLTAHQSLQNSHTRI